VQDHVYPLVDCEWLVDTVNDIESSICEDIAYVFTEWDYLFTLITEGELIRLLQQC
jgi:hypothetical protein